MNSFPPPTTAPAGWYPDPHTGSLRYYDGRAWVGEPVVAPYVRSPRPEHPRLPLAAAVGAIVVLTASLVAGKLVVDALIDYDWPLLVYIALVSIVSYGPSIAWADHVRRRWGEGTWS